MIERRTYLRPLDEEGVEFETPTQALDRVMGHQRSLWEAAVGRPLNRTENDELDELRWWIEQKKVSLSGRVKWMGGTDIVKQRASGAFNCSYTHAETPADMVDIFWLLLQGCGVGFKPRPGLMYGFPTSVQTIKIIPSVRTDKGGAEDTVETIEDGVWTIKFGDSAKAWAKAVGKLTATKTRAHTLVLDYSELRPGGKRLKGYGWLSSGWEPLKNGMAIITEVMMRKADQQLDAVDILDLVNALGTVLSSRRSAQIGLIDSDHKDAPKFAEAKVDRWLKGKGHREQSNNTLMFVEKPPRETVVELLHIILATGDPGFANLREMQRRAPEADGGNPCFEILMSSKSFCNLVQVVWHRFNGQYADLKRAQWIAARANYRQTCVSMRDGVLQLRWDDNQKLLRLCGVSPTGYVSWEGLDNPEMLEGLRDAAIAGANQMADELGQARPRRVTQVQPAGTSSKSLGLEGDEVHEGAHCALSRWIFNNVNFSALDPIVQKLQAANYHTFPNPVDPTGVIVRFPVEYPASPLFTRTADGLEIYTESAVAQLERYRILMKHYVQHNVSITISFDEDEIEDMADWFMEHWDDYVGVSFLRRNDPSRTAADLGFAYLPQEAVSQETFAAYASTLLPVSLDDDQSDELLQIDDCSTGACPVR